MTTFKEIRGKLIRTLDTDPTPVTTYEGQIWYNKTIGVLKGATFTASSWSSAPNMNTARDQVANSSDGSQSSAWAAGGSETGAPLSDASVATESYNGTSWTTGSNMPEGRRGLAGFGSQTAGVSCGGFNSPPYNMSLKTEEWNGSSWATTGNLTRTLYLETGTGSQTAGLVWCDATNNSPPFQVTQEYNGSTWTAVNEQIVSKIYSAAAGPQTAALSYGGTSPTVTNDNNQSYDGTSWVSENNLITGKGRASGNGTQTAAWVAGGTNPPTTITGETQIWDGTCWSSDSATLAVLVQNSRGAGASNAGILFSGYNGTADVATTQEYNASAYETKTLTTS